MPGALSIANEEDKCDRSAAKWKFWCGDSRRHHLADTRYAIHLVGKREQTSETAALSKPRLRRIGASRHT
jgi:hypothetical protein